MTRCMRDGITLANIPVAGLDIIAVYSNGSYFDKPADVTARFSKTPVVWIDVTGENPGADVLDVEPGDATPDTAPGWAKAHRARFPGGYPPVIYCNRNTLTPVANAMEAIGYRPGHEFNWWIATLDGKTKTVPDMTGVAAVQWLGRGGYDESIVYDPTWKPSPKPAPVVHVTAPAPPGRWIHADMVGIGTDGAPWAATYDSATGRWSAPVRIPGA